MLDPTRATRLCCISRIKRLAFRPSSIAVIQAIPADRSSHSFQLDTSCIIEAVPAAAGIQSFVGYVSGVETGVVLTDCAIISV